jgi:hypothetical protein
MLSFNKWELFFKRALHHNPYSYLGEEFSFQNFTENMSN